MEISNQVSFSTKVFFIVTSDGINKSWYATCLHITIAVPYRALNHKDLSVSDQSVNTLRGKVDQSYVPVVYQHLYALQNWIAVILSNYVTSLLTLCHIKKYNKIWVYFNSSSNYSLEIVE